MDSNETFCLFRLLFNSIIVKVYIIDYEGMPKVTREDVLKHKKNGMEIGWYLQIIFAE
jgi:hypothetical protein